MKKIIAMLMVAVVMTGCGRIETGEVGVRTNFNKSVETEELTPGFYGALFSSVNKHVVKETEITMDDLRPKAKDNLSLEDLDISVFYTINPAKVADMEIKYAGMTAVAEDGSLYPQFNLVSRYVRGAVYDVIGSKFDSLTIHNKRNDVELDIMKEIQTGLDASDKGVFTITKVVVRKVDTDKSLEESIRNSVRVQKEIEQKTQQVALATSEAERLRVEALGQAAANTIIANSITPQLIELRRIETMAYFAKEGTHTVIMPTDTKALVNIGK
jgi:hypothetical protein